MNALCPQHQQTLLSNPKQALHTCRKLIEEGTQCNHAAEYQESCQRFLAGIEISQMLLAQCPCPVMTTNRVPACWPMLLLKNIAMRYRYIVNPPSSSN